MAKISNLVLAPENQDLFYSSIKPQDRFIYARVTSKKVFFSRKHLKGLSVKTLLPTISLLWSALSSGDKAKWEAASFFSSLNGFRLFVSDTSYRLAHGISGIANASNYHQVKIGYVQISAPAKAIKLLQFHPFQYWIQKKVSGTKNQMQMVSVTENFSLPFEISLSFKTNLTAVGPNPFCRFYAQVVSSYQGVDRFNYAIIDIDLVSDWDTQSQVITQLLGHFISYELFIELNDVQGDFWFDNVSAYHSMHEWARDSLCNNINQNFTKQWQQIPAHWVAENLPSGANFLSIYPED